MQRPLHLLLVFLFFVCSSAQVLADALPASSECPLIDHLYEVNKEWAHQAPALSILWQPVQFENDEARIQRHLELVEEILRQRTVSLEESSEKEHRLQQLDVLRAYHQRGLFPKNTGHQIRQPYFIDNYGTACAVGYLVIEDGYGDLANQIKAEKNFAYIREMPYPELGKWATANGFTVDELAWIQPAYQPQPRTYQGVGNNLGVEGTVHTMIKSPDEDILYMAGDFSAVDGVNANSIIAWDGENWSTLGNGVEGTIYAMSFNNNTLYIGGNFSLIDEPNATNFAYWNGSEWIGLQTGDMEGAIYAMYGGGYNRILLGGSFQKVNGQQMRHFVLYEPLDDNYRNDTYIYQDGELITIPHGMSVNGAVRSITTPAFNSVLIGGDFTLTSADADHPSANKIETNYLAYWGYNDWDQGLYGPHGPVHHVASLNGALYVGGQVDHEEGGFAVLEYGLWTDFQYYLQPFGDNLVHGFIEVDDRLICHGGFSYYPGVGNWGTGAALIHESYYGEGFSLFDNSVRAAAEFQGKLIFAGDFSSVDNQDFPGLTQLDYLTSIPEPIEQVEELRFYADGENLHIFHTESLTNASLRVFNMAGQEIGTIALQNSTGETVWSYNQLATGMYVYQLNSKEGIGSGKFVIN